MKWWQARQAPPPRTTARQVPELELAGSAR
jgi:hypothetical protein